MFNGKSFNEKFLLMRKYYDFARAINCTHKLTCVCVYACACDRTRLREQYGNVIILHKCPKNYGHMVYCSWDMARDRRNCYFSFCAIFCPFTPLTARKIKISKNWKNAWRYHHFTNVYQKLWLDDARFLRYDAQQMDTQTNGWMDGKSDT